MAQAKLPAFQFYPGDWRKDPGIQALCFHDRGVWFEILCLMHESEERGKLTLAGRPMPDDALARLLGLDKQILTTTITTILTYGVASRCPTSGALISRRMVRDENLRQIRANAGKQGGNPVLLKQKSTSRVKQNPTPSSSSSVSSSDISPRPAAPDGAEVEAIYHAYPRKQGKHGALRAITNLLKRNPPQFAGELLAKVQAYAAAVHAWPAGNEQFIPHPATWFNDGRYDDDPATWQRKDAPKAKTERSDFQHDDYSKFRSAV